MSASNQKAKLLHSSFLTNGRKLFVIQLADGTTWVGPMELVESRPIRLSEFVMKYQ